jgi:hypothetical protein
MTTNRIKSVMGLFKYVLPQTREVAARGIDISMIDHVQKGQLTKRFLLAKQEPAEEHQKLLEDESTSLSIIYRVGSDVSLLDGLSQKDNRLKRFETLDLVVANAIDYLLLVTALEDLLEVYRNERLTFDRNILLLQHHWIDMDKDLKDTMSVNEWLCLCDKLNVPLKKHQLVTLFKDMARDLNLEDGGLSLWIISELISDLKYHSMEAAGLKFVNQDPLLRLWHDIIGTDPVPAAPLKILDNIESAESLEIKAKGSEEEKTVSSVALLSFIRSQQKAYKTTLENTMDMISALNQQVSVKELAGDEPYPKDLSSSRDRLSKSRFFSYLSSDANDLLDPAKGKVGADDMTHPLSHYWINASHDTYMNNWPLRNNNVGQPDEQMYLSALYRGVRCLEIDVWDGVTGEPVICRNKPRSAEDRTIEFPYALRAIREFLLAHPDSYPVILNLENHCSFPVQERVADHLFQILGSPGLIVVPDESESVDDADLLPSPASMQGKVIVMGKRPKIVKEGAKVVNDDFDVENDEYHDDALPNAKSMEEEHEIEDGIVIGFDAAGPIRSMDPLLARNVVQHSAGELLYLTEQEAERLKIEAAQAELNAVAADEEADRSMAHAEAVIKRAGLQKEQIEDIANEIRAPGQHVEQLNRGDEEGVEIQEFFGDAVEGAKINYAEAEGIAIAAAEAATATLQKLNEANEFIREVEVQLEKSYSLEKQVMGVGQRAAANARNKREHADTARERVETVRRLLLECESSSSSAENVVNTAVTEAKISEKRAIETESRASRAMVTAKKDQIRSDEETKKEEELEREAAELHEQCVIAAQAEKEARDHVEKAATNLEKVYEQVKLTEQTEKRQAYDQRLVYDHVHEEKSGNSSQANKLEETRKCSELLKEASARNVTAEARRRKAQADFEEKAHAWKRQADDASHARKQSDRSSHTSEALAEHADEEREAAILRKSAKEKARSNVSEKGAYRASLQSQLAEAERAAEEAERIAVAARDDAERRTKDNEEFKGHGDILAIFEKRKARRDEILGSFQAKKAVKEDAEKRALEAKRHYATSSEVLSSAMQNAAKETNRVNGEKSADEKAVDAFNSARLARKQADHALELARLAQSTVSEKLCAVRRASEYKEKTDKISEIPVALAKMTFLHSTKHRYWRKSLELPNTYMHSFSQGVVSQMSLKDPRHRKKLREFSVEHMCRTFPSWKHDTNTGNEINFDPIFQWALGCQLVSMNFSTFDDHVLKADGRFRKNGSCGYVLKPSFLTADNYKNRVEREQQWKINVLCGSCLPNPESSGRRGGSNHSHINPYVKIVVYEGAANGQKKTIEHRTREVKKNGLNPVWDDKQGFSFSVISPVMSIVVFTVWDKSESGTDEIIGSAAMPISCLREGYRSVALFDSNHSRAGPYAYASLFVRAQKISA